MNEEFKPENNPESQEEKIEKLKKELVEEAIKQYSEVFPTLGKSWDECFTKIRHEGKNGLLLWFNDKNNSTHAVFKEIV
jgi:hypothetical protein